MDALRSWIEPQTIPVNFVLVPDSEPSPNIIKGKYHSFPQIAPGDNLGLARAIRALFQNRFHWCAFALGREVDGSTPYVDLHHGYAFCLNGAAWVHDKNWSRAQKINFFRFLGFEPQKTEWGYGEESAHFNNHQGYEAVIRRLDRVIAAHS
jgi:hypothetical protein